jgi:hypothetical protein
MSKPKFKVGDEVWTGNFWHDRTGKPRASVKRRTVVEIYKNYLKKFGTRYCLVQTAKLPDIDKTRARTGESRSSFGMAFAEERMFRTEAEARDFASNMVRAELNELNDLLFQVSTGLI